MDSTPAFVREVLGLFDKADVHSELFWRVEDDDVQLFADVSDVFEWGTADLEEITPERLPILQRAYDDLVAVDSAVDLVVLYAARVRGQRPQGAAYPDHPTVRALLDECGPERPLGLGNPMTPAALDRLDADLVTIAGEMAAAERDDYALGASAGTADPDELADRLRKAEQAYTALRERFDATEAARARWQKRGEETEAALKRVRDLCNLTIATSCRVQAIDQARDTLAAIDHKETADA